MFPICIGIVYGSSGKYPAAQSGFGDIHGMDPRGIARSVADGMSLVENDTLERTGGEEGGIQTDFGISGDMDGGTGSGAGARRSSPHGASSAECGDGESAADKFLDPPSDEIGRTDEECGELDR
jgi:hypothetical protein